VKSHLAKILRPKAALFVLLVFQLVIGLPLQTAQAALERPDAQVPAPTTARSQMLTARTPAAHTAGTPAATAVATTAQADCPMHDSVHGATPAKGGNKHTPAGNHDCCHVSACQCHCVYTPAAFDLPPLADVATTVAIPSLSSAQFVAPRIDEFLRPPIA
jgi:hypothetical protein